MADRLDHEHEVLGDPVHGDPRRTGDEAKLRAVLNWLFRDRRTGAIVVAQFPNAPLMAWLALLGLGLLWQPRAGWGTALAVMTTAALGIWAVDETVRGVNPFRRFLGVGVLGYLIVSFVASR